MSERLHADEPAIETALALALIYIPCYRHSMPTGVHEAWRLLAEALAN